MILMIVFPLFTIYLLIYSVVAFSVYEKHPFFFFTLLSCKSIILDLFLKRCSCSACVDW